MGRTSTVTNLVTLLRQAWSELIKNIGIVLERVIMGAPGAVIRARGRVIRH